MAVSFRQASGTNDGAASGTVVLPLAPIAGNLLVLHVTALGAESLTPAGYTLQASLSLGPSNNRRGRTYTRVSNGTERSQTFQLGEAAQFSAVYAEYAGTDAAAPVQAVASRESELAGAANNPIRSNALAVERRGSAVVVLVSRSDTNNQGYAGGDLTLRNSAWRPDGTLSSLVADGLPVNPPTAGERATNMVQPEPWASTTLLLRSANAAPSTPGAFTSPTAGQVVNTTASIAWGASTDADGDAVEYFLDLSLDNGATFRNNILNGSTTLTSVVYDFTGEPTTTAAVLRVIARDAAGAFSFFTVGPAFTIQHNQPPTAATELTPNGQVLDRTSTQRFAYRFNDPNPGDTQSKRDRRVRLIGAPAWTTATDLTTAAFFDVPGNTYAAGDYEWQIRPYDSQGEPAPWSPSAFFTAATPPPGPTILSPANNGTIGTGTGVLTWSYPTQQAYQVRKLADLDGQPDPENVLFDTGTVPSATARDQALEFPVNGRVEHLQVRVQDRETGLWSPWSSVRITVSYTPPPKPVVGVRYAATGRHLEVAYVQPALEPDQPGPDYVDVYRRLQDVGGEGIRRAKDLRPVGEWIDYAVAFGVRYEYRVAAYATNGTSSTSDWTPGFPGPAFPSLATFPSPSTFPET